MHDTLRARVRRILEVVTQSTRVLTWLGFGREPAPPTEPIHHADLPPEPRGGAAPHLHDQQHVQPGKRAEIDQPGE